MHRTWEYTEIPYEMTCSADGISAAGYDQELRSQLPKAFVHEIPGVRGPYYRKRDRPPRQAASPDPSPAPAPIYTLLSCFYFVFCLFLFVWQSLWNATFDELSNYHYHYQQELHVSDGPPAWRLKKKNTK